MPEHQLPWGNVFVPLKNHDEIRSVMSGRVTLIDHKVEAMSQGADHEITTGCQVCLNRSCLLGVVRCICIQGRVVGKGCPECSSHFGFHNFAQVRERGIQIRIALFLELWLVRTFARRHRELINDLHTFLHNGNR